MYYESVQDIEYFGHTISVYLCNEGALYGTYQVIVREGDGMDGTEWSGNWLFKDSQIDACHMAMKVGEAFVDGVLHGGKK